MLIFDITFYATKGKVTFEDCFNVIDSSYIEKIKCSLQEEGFGELKSVVINNFRQG